MQKINLNHAWVRTVVGLVLCLVSLQGRREELRNNGDIGGVSAEGTLMLKSKQSFWEARDTYGYGVCGLRATCPVVDSLCQAVSLQVGSYGSLPCTATGLASSATYYATPMMPLYPTTCVTMSDLSDSENHSKAEYEDSESSSDGSSTSSGSSFSEEDVQEIMDLDPDPLPDDEFLNALGDGATQVPAKKAASSYSDNIESKEESEVETEEGSEEESEKGQESPAYHFNPRLVRGLLEDIQAIYQIPPDIELYVPSPNDLPNSPPDGFITYYADSFLAELPYKVFQNFYWIKTLPASVGGYYFQGQNVGKVIEGCPDSNKIWKYVWFYVKGNREAPRGVALPKEERVPQEFQSVLHGPKSLPSQPLI
ncbi:hypothetical protein TIFTF001_027185 [Ficus carica]|uniref:Uncharacterized protein n=1 Tax=Ficus carica TaxID=3494 RepID=A0AA88DNQ8_FICCA|nr:hypothetical protein TIFTF001_027185 [Ficus carica]